MASFTINVSFNGVHVFRTDEADSGFDNYNRNTVVDLFQKKFPKSEGYEVMVVDWPDRTGKITYLE